MSSNSVCNHAVFSLLLKWTPVLRSSEFVTHMITDQIVLPSVLLPLIIN